MLLEDDAGVMFPSHTPSTLQFSLHKRQVHLKEWQGVTVNQMVPPITDVIPMWTHCLSESLFPLHSSVDLVNTVFVLFSSFGLVGF